MRTGILGGTFDPIHIAHLHAAECALHQLRLDRVLVIPAGDPWQKSDRTVSPAEHRVEMCRLAVNGIDGLEVDTREVDRNGASYTIDTLESFPTDEELFLIVGSDAAANLGTWHRAGAVVERATVAIVPRPGATIPSIKGGVVISMGLLDVSGTEIRRRASVGEPYRFLVTGPVHSYIERHLHFAQDGGGDMVGGLESMESSS